MCDGLWPLGFGWTYQSLGTQLDFECAYAFVENLISTNTKSNIFDKPGNPPILKLWMLGRQLYCHPGATVQLPPQLIHTFSLGRSW